MKSQEEIDREWAELETESEEAKNESEGFDFAENMLVMICAGIGFIVGVFIGAFVLKESSYAMWIGAILGGGIGKLIQKMKNKKK